MATTTAPATTSRSRRDPLYRTVVPIALTTCRLMRWKVAISGEEHIPASGPAILAANHIGKMDFVFLGMAGHRRGRLVRFMTMREAFEHWLAGPLLRGMRHIPVDRTGDAAAGFHLATRALEDGEVVGIHPEGRISRDLVPRAGKTGAVRMALATGAPLVPAAIWGSHQLIAPGARVKFPGNVRISVAVGEPLLLEPAADVDELTSRLMARIDGLRRHMGRHGPADDHQD
jgi:1-acyl-sn-glycerol-3-phosphate acyltransferase